MGLWLTKSSWFVVSSFSIGVKLEGCLTVRQFGQTLSTTLTSPQMRCTLPIKDGRSPMTKTSETLGWKVCYLEIHGYTVLSYVITSHLLKLDGPVAESMDPETEKTWKSLVYNVNISSSDVQQFYNSWAVQYDQDQVKLRTGYSDTWSNEHKDQNLIFQEALSSGADHLADALVEALEQREFNKHEVTWIQIKVVTT